MNIGISLQELSGKKIKHELTEYQQNIVDFIQTSVEESLQQSIFILNDEDTRVNVQEELSHVLADAFCDDMITGFHVICDETNNSESTTLIANVQFTPKAYPNEISMIAVVKSSSVD